MVARTFIVSAGVSVAAGLMGAFALMRRMTLAADALSHVALPGIALALIFGVDPLAGALVALLCGALLVWSLGRRTTLATEAIIGVVFSAALALGAILTTGDELLDILFGTNRASSTTETAIGLIGAACVIAFAILARDRLVLTFVSADVATTARIDVRRLELAYLVAFALTVALGLRFLGVLLMGSLLIIPAATARLLARGLTQMLVFSSAIAVFSTVVGTAIAGRMHQETGPPVVLVASACFIAALIAPKRQRRSSRAVRPS
jgi:ABC-type Mn2+/Zn2+ transport system permease subunit